MALKRMLILFIIIIVFINLATYTIFVSSGNVFQQYAYEHHLALNIYSHDSVISFRITTLILILCLFKQFQKLNYQRAVISVLMLILFLLPISVKTFPILSGCSNTINTLSQAWLQLYLPSAFRATITGFLASMYGFIAIRSAYMEKFLSASIANEYITGGILIVSLFFFLIFSFKIKAPEANESPEPTESIFKLILKYPLVFIICFFAGLNAGIIFYTLILGAEALPKQPPQIYQYIVYAATILGPVALGRCADKFGIAFVAVCSVFVLTLCSVFNFGLSYMHIEWPIPYYIVAFIDAGFVASLWGLVCSLIGKNLRNQGIFRSMAISNIILNVGILSCVQILQQFSQSYLFTMLVFSAINLCFWGVIWYLYVYSASTQYVK
ncbi:MAG: hypothetical protein Q8R83_03415 [Legionellaceae bacterium]|nr:hypothetical protein [Legionellaceae bacterium]